MDYPTFVNIKEVIKTTVTVSNKIAIFVTNLDLFKSVTVDVHFYNLDETSVIDVKRLKLEGTDYDNWSNDDSYIVTYVITKLDLSVKSV